MTDAGAYGEAEPSTVYDTPSADDPHACPECGMGFEGPAWHLQRGLHRKKEHGVAGKGQRPKKGTTAPSRARARVEGTAERTPAGEKAPRTTPSRVRLDKVGSWTWRGVSRAADSAGFPAAGRCLTMQADAVGPVFEKAVKGTFADKMLQPVAKFMENGTELGSFVGLPIAAEAFQRNPNAMTQIAFVEALEANLPYIAKSIKEAEKRRQKLEAELAELATTFGKNEGDPVTLQEIGNYILTGSTNPPRPEPENLDGYGPRPEGAHYAA